MHFYTKWRPDYAGTLYKFIRVMKLSFILLITVFLQNSFAGFTQELTISKKNISLEQLFREIRLQTGYNVLYDGKTLEATRLVSVNVTKAPLETVLRKSLQGQMLQYKITNNTIIISPIPNPVTGKMAIIISGKVVDEKNLPLPGASVWEVGTKNSAMSTPNGAFSLAVIDSNAVIEVRYIGYVVKRVTVKSGNYKTIQLQPDQKNLDEVVINNGLFERKAGTFTGATSTFSGEQLKVVTNQNLIKGLAILDPSFQIIESNSFGSNPNRLPDVQLRGQTGIPDLNAEYANQPNQPIFILDGFRATLQRVFDLNINMIKSVTLLKDASAKAIYGADAGNGVVVIETITPEAGALRVSYRGSLNITAPDLSSYNLTNSEEKIQAETLAGKYTSAYPAQQADLLRQFARNQKAALDGVDTYWLSQPLQNGYGQQHSINLDGGDNSMRYSANLNYNNVSGVMIGSSRKTLSGSINLIYRLKNFAFTNILTVDNNKAINSKYGSFSDYARMNPYWRITDDAGALIQNYQGFSVTTNNPLYNASLNTKDNSSYRNVTENFYTEWSIQKNLRVMGRVGITSQTSESEYFLPANHTNYLGIQPSSPEYQNRGEYRQTNGKQNILSSDLSAAYNLQFGKNQIFANAIASINTNSNESTGFIMVGFPNDNIDDIAFGNQYKPGTKASGAENTIHNIALTSALNYSYDNRFLADLSYRSNASSQFGANNQWGSFSSAGLGWNLHNESWIKPIKFINQLRLRASVGNTGTPISNGYLSVATYQYVTSQNYNGDIAMQLMGLPNPDLQWQKVLDKNIGTDMLLFSNLSLRADFFIKDTKGLLTDQVTAPSLGFVSYKENIGEVRNKGYQIGANMNVIRENRKSLSVFVNVAHSTNKIRRVSNSILALNAANDNSAFREGETPEARRLRLQRPYARYVPNQSMSTIWAVKSLGIDPSNGREIFEKADGTQTYVYSTDDLVNSGDTNPDITGTFGTNMRFGNFTAGFAFTLRLGGQMYNSTLVERVENVDFAYNVDIRALEERWKTPGQASLYKDIADLSTTQLSSRFVQNLDELALSSISFGYDFNKLKISKNKQSRASANINLNDLARFSTVKTERGLDYPFARTISLSLQASF
ncbi:SusC/RagA family TonB-linked outer membrane protein [Pedobacter sp. MC2016-14]|uniref:SusC/RagA family TonB-linked outer membrane protein n=1 Tax=Pedobacter sp. MC2016-14 TaxID=2897327 RepID=UPI001E4FF9F1|nr:SusC/RagA family TonB-linked outer membrane protein [Pedobacter sp. MC2016-14]MCD0490394.1 SusC/RagA family TonB-linked outer membrane protein [Pedobacter sp. MC2016-14]